MRLVIGLLAVFAAAAQQNDEVALQAAVQKEVVDGDSAAALKQYEALVKSTNRTVAARALLRIGRLYEKGGDSAKAAAVYDRVAKEFADQSRELVQAQDRLRLLTGPASGGRPVGWYNGDWQSGIGGLENWYLSEEEYGRVYDDFFVPQSGWTIVSVFSNNRMDYTGVKFAKWEIRRDTVEGNGGKVVAGGLSPATQTVVPGNGPFPADPMIGYRIQVDGLKVKLAKGHYWLSMAPVGLGKSYANSTLGRNSLGRQRGDLGNAFYRSSLYNNFKRVDPMKVRGQVGATRDFSMGVIIQQ